MPTTTRLRTLTGDVKISIDLDPAKVEPVPLTNQSGTFLPQTAEFNFFAWDKDGEESERSDWTVSAVILHGPRIIKGEATGRISKRVWADLTDEADESIPAWVREEAAALAPHIATGTRTLPKSDRLKEMEETHRTNLAETGAEQTGQWRRAQDLLFPIRRVGMVGQLISLGPHTGDTYLAQCMPGRSTDHFGITWAVVIDGKVIPERSYTSDQALIIYLAVKNGDFAAVSAKYAARVLGLANPDQKS